MKINRRKKLTILSILMIIFTAVILSSVFVSGGFMIRAREQFNNRVTEELNNIGITLVTGYAGKLVFYATTENITDIIEYSKTDPFKPIGIVTQDYADSIKTYTVFDADSDMAYRITTPVILEWHWFWEIINLPKEN